MQDTWAMRRRLLALGFATVALLSALLWILREGPTQPGIVVTSGVPTTNSARVVLDADSRTEIPQLDSPIALESGALRQPGASDVNPLTRGFGTTHEFLQAYWGADWPRVVDSLKLIKNLDAILETVDVHKIPTWESTKATLLANILKGLATRQEEEVSGILEWGRGTAALDLAANDLNPGERCLDKKAQDELRYVIDALNSDIVALVRSYYDESRRVFTEAMDSEPEGVLVRHPVLMPGFSPPACHLSDCLYKKMISNEYWTVAISITRSRYPLLADLRESVDRALADRRTAVRDFIAVH